MSTDKSNGLRQWGRALFERQRQPVIWASLVLKAATLRLGSTPEIDEILQMAADETQWSHGRDFFDRVRHVSLEAEDRPAVQLLFRLAELVGKLAHNAAGPPPYFDHHSGWQVGPVAYRLAVEVEDPSLQDGLATALGDWPLV
ncbi:hypothetical protein [Streptomyces albidocamelliae]|uniref:Uncharacterized protein n=1 Tax=Streptomyces albidocamelliae TaxID=2981135 RepID=A0ABY6EES9_9ACTN|nr:hypothetical protein [Streptomyces sp. HUAS 14-6]UXY33282.1 hypothetical protein N8I86_00095 [Streptomyces sp. HUAS 14-6]